MKNPIDDLKDRAKSAIKQLSEGVQGSVLHADSVVSDLRALLRERPASRVELGPIVGELSALLKTSKEATSFLWVPIGGGHMAIGHRPRMRDLVALRQQGATHVLTLLAESEGAGVIGTAARKAGMDWLWFPLRSAQPPHNNERIAELRGLYDSIRDILAAGGKVYVHCSAGIHRTGMITYGLLRSIGLSAEAAIVSLHTLRAETRRGAGDLRLAWGDRFAPGGLA